MAKKPSLKSSGLADALLRAGAVSADTVAAVKKSKAEEAARAAREQIERAFQGGEPRGIAGKFLSDTSAQSISSFTTSASSTTERGASRRGSRRRSRAP